MLKRGLLRLRSDHRPARGGISFISTSGTLRADSVCDPRIIRGKQTPEAVRKDRRGQTGDLIGGLRANMEAPNVEDSKCEVEELLWGLEHKSAWLWERLTGGQPGHLRAHFKCCLDGPSHTVRFYELGLKVARSRNPSPTWPQPGWTWIFWTWSSCGDSSHSYSHTGKIMTFYRDWVKHLWE